jgi:hypothetical protein
VTTGGFALAKNWGQAEKSCAAARPDASRMGMSAAEQRVLSQFEYEDYASNKLGVYRIQMGYRLATL